ncbi:Tuftelininteracting protein 11like [Caligus rogercresseyi]|uniref:Tuftelininteracting protein 11like n=1 Tax=Caligus rogercresseyi TaxID=217165 RepID=A0A7T8GM19_CALRO|nr:Tuftelininteracting protein 11like [Caligus rogercresseyi]
MANEEEVMRFEITDQDLDDELNYESRRPRRSKNSAIYGIWADKSEEDDSEEGEDLLSFGKRSSGRQKKGGSYTNSSSHINFVSAGVQKKDPKESGIDDEERDLSPTKIIDSDSEDETVRPSFGQRRKREGYEARGGEIAGLRSANYNPNISLGKGFGEWEKFTKGIGAKLLLQMGYQAGKGLGKDLQGRSTIVEAFQRKGKGAIGAYGREGSRPKASIGEAGADEEGERASSWRKESSKQASKVKYVYKSIDQVLDEGKWRKVRETPEAKAAHTKVIDMTGKEHRVLSGYHAIASSKHVPDEDVEMSTDLSKVPSSSSSIHFDLPELTHNLDMLVDMCEENIISSDRKVKYHKDRIEVLTNEEEKLSAVVERGANEIKSVKRILEALDFIEEQHGSSKLLSSEDIVNPILKAELEMWNPLVSSSPESEKVRNNFHSWKSVLCINPRADSPQDDPYYSILWETWMPKVRTTINLWQAKVAPDALISFLTSWFTSSLVPQWMQDNILLQLVLPKIQNDVDNWNPQTDTVPIHSWLHPWLPLLHNHLEIVYPTIRNKLGRALTNWEPSDRSAKLILLPWKDVFSRGSLHAFLIKYVLPKLELSIQKLIINPSSQDLAPWNAVMEWVDLLPINVIVGLLEKHFFPKWLQVLASWLNHCPNYNEVSKWYEGWKSIVYPEILAHSQVKHHFVLALDMMNPVQHTMQPPPPPKVIPPPFRPQAVPMGFRDLVAKRVKKTGKTDLSLWESAYLSGSECDIRTGAHKDIWVPTSLNVLMDNA